MKRLFYLLSVIFGLSACTSNKDKTPVLGNFDSLAIAMDTTLQLGLESSYEFHKTLNVNDTLVYDVVGYGGSAAKGEYAILRRGADNKTDTVQKGVREGYIAETFLADSNRNGAQEIYVIVKAAGNSGMQKNIKYELKQ
ncbi:MAG TPA: hypothetical protein VK154_01380 [Chitinophagales bacterium]|nr:hypothetical protein [Chitinophagales bacterium]